MQQPRVEQLGEVRTICHGPNNNAISWTKALCAATVGVSGPISRVNYGETAGCSVQIVPQYLRPRWVPQLAHGLGLDLTDPLPSYPVDLADLIKRLRLTVGQSEPHRDDSSLAFAKCVQHVV